MDDPSNISFEIQQQRPNGMVTVKACVPASVAAEWMKLLSDKRETATIEQAADTLELLYKELERIPPPEAVRLIRDLRAIVRDIKTKTSSTKI
jgi:hypothetical protein